MWRSYAGLAAARLGESERAVELVDEELAIARRFGAAEAIGEALRVRALVAPRAEMAERAREAVDVLAGSDLRLSHARALIDLGGALRRAGHRRDARGPLRDGLDLANRCGSVIETDRAMDELRAAGSRPRRPAVRGVDALSAQERRVAGMAAEGLGNREIAEALFLTRRTVEMHLTGVYRKLGVAGRTDLPAGLGRHRDLDRVPEPRKATDISADKHEGKKLTMFKRRDLSGRARTSGDSTPRSMIGTWMGKTPRAGPLGGPCCPGGRGQRSLILMICCGPCGLRQHSAGRRSRRSASSVRRVSRTVAGLSSPVGS